MQLASKQANSGCMDFMDQVHGGSNRQQDVATKPGMQ